MEESALPNKQVNITESQEEIHIAPSIIKAYTINMLKALFFLGSIIGSYYLVLSLVGYNPYPEILKTLGIPTDIMIKLLAGAVIIFLFLIMVYALSISSRAATLKNNSLTYSSGLLLKETNQIPLTSIVKVNFKQYPLSKIGDLKIHLSGTEEEVFVISYVSKVEENCLKINEIIHLRGNENNS